MRKRSRSGFALIELLVVLLIIAGVYYLTQKLYFKKPSVGNELGQTLAHQGIDTTNYKTIMDTTKAQLAHAKMRQAERTGNVE